MMSRGQKSFHMMLAATKEGGIGKDGALPWNIPSDLKWFKEVTGSVSRRVGSNKGGEDAPPAFRNAVIMGASTYLSIPERFRPLKNRFNIVLSRSPYEEAKAKYDLPETVAVANSIDDALEQSEKQQDIDQIFLIGGKTPFEQGLTHPACERIYYTKVFTHFECDTFICPLDATEFQLIEERAIQEENDTQFQFLVFQKRPPAPSSVGESRSSSSSVTGTARPFDAPNNRVAHEEYQYLSAIRDIIENGVRRVDRTQVGTLSKFGVTMRYSLRDEILPLLTTKRVFWRGVAEELLWFIHGETDAKKLQEKKIHIWDGNGSREFLDSKGFTDREEGDLGPVYGFQWRHFGAQYKDCKSDYSDQGVDQLAEVIEKIKNNPTDRRIILSAWNPAALGEMALPPCHMMCQFYVADGELHCQMYQRSADMGLGVPFNIASYALLTRLIAQVTGLRAGELVHVIGDAHVYLNHIDPLKEQLKRTPRPFPVLRIAPEVTDILDFRYEHFTIEGYNPHAKIQMEMAV
eukprot:gb/GECG01013054.1/.p1 GENE.gb/GECG01013054.1/~~gb/GECG01013054.1/.p1  ORF type:complete len:519 (+),score=67.36 gb/GECG01013054.1/:1-1557(+)